MQVGLSYKNKKINIDAEFCKGYMQFIGLMFTRREKAKALVFDFSNQTRKAIHSCFVFFPFVAVWIDKESKIVEIKKIKPFISLIKPKKSFSKLVEIPINNKYKEAVELLVGD